MCGRQHDANLRGLVVVLEEGAFKPLVLPLVCEECGIYYADLPGKICVGCEAYKDHQR